MENYRKIELSKDNVLNAKELGNDALSELITKCKSSVGDLVFVLENIGSLPKSFPPNVFIELLSHENENVRLWAIKNLGKLESLSLLPVFTKVISNDSSTMVKRESVSSIGRLRNHDTIPVLIGVLEHNDPKIVCQAIRGLLVFKGNEEVDKALRQLVSHENEMVVSVIKKEFFDKSNADAHSIRHTETCPLMDNVVVNGDVREVLEIVPNQSIHLTFTSPPYYNARDYSIYPSYEAYLDFLEDVFRETYRITKEGRFLVVNTSPVIVPRISRAHSSKRYPIPFDLHTRLTKLGWEFIDDIIWMKPEYSVKNRIGGFQQHRKPLAYKPNSVTEYLMVYRKSTTKLIDWNIHQYDIDIVNESRVPEGYETTNVWQICPKSDKVHSAVFPIELCQRVIQYYSYIGDLVFDPFGGSGTVGRAANSLHRKFFLTEIEKKYFEYMKSFSKNTIFDENATRFLTFEQFKKSMI